MIRKFKKTRGQSALEFAALIMFLLGAYIVSQKYIVRGFSGRWKGVGDALGQGRIFDPNETVECATNIYFEGQELDRFENFMGALSLDYFPKDNLRIQFISSAFQTRESETFDILGEYYIGKLENQIGEEQFGEVVEAQGVGAFLDQSGFHSPDDIMDIDVEFLLIYRNR